MDLKLDVAIRPDIAEQITATVGKLRFLHTQQILVVVDDGIGLVPSPGGFGVGRVLEIIDSLDFVLARTRITVAVRQGPVAKLTPVNHLQSPTYTGFRFDRTEPGGGATLDRFDQVWCFGLKPIVHSPGPADDAGIDPIDANEVAALRQWMDETGGGVLAMGDHGLLGADMCSAIPRVRLMRRWKEATDVPDQVGTGRLDTHRPANPAQTYHPVTNPSPAQIPGGAQQDAVPQDIEWVPDQTIGGPVFRRQRPHPILCHPTLGPIDVLPDHAHEGRCYDSQSETLVDPDGDFSIDGPGPETIAYGHTLPDPPWDHAKGAQPARRFPLITVYDGQQVGQGRIVVDSTWHHWFDLNIWDLEAAGGDQWAKIRRYFENVAIWLAKPSWRSWTVAVHLGTVKWSYLAVQEIDLTMSTRALGRALLAHLRPRLGPCWVTSLVYDIVDDRVWQEVIFPRVPDGCLSCPPFELIEEYLYGALARRSLEHAAKLEVPLRSPEITAKDLRVNELAEELPGAMRAGLAELVKDYQEDLRHASEVVERMASVAYAP